MGPEGSLPRLRQPTTCPYPETDQSSPCSPSHILKIHLNIILPSMLGSSKWSLSLRFSHKNPVCTSPVLHASYMLNPHFLTVVFPMKPEGKRSLGRPRRRWEDNIQMDLQEVGGGRGDWMELAQDRDGWRALVGKVRNFRVP